MSEGTLFELPASEERPSAGPTGPQEARVLRPMRQQLHWAPVDLESLLAFDNPARAIWGFLEKLDLTAFYEPIKAVVDRPGRPPTDPQVLQRGCMAEWTNAQVRLHGVSQFSVRGLPKSPALCSLSLSPTTSRVGGR